MKRKKLTRWSPAPNLRRTKDNSGKIRYFHKGKPTTEKKFKSKLSSYAAKKFKGGKLNESQRQYWSKLVGGKKLQKQLKKQAKREETRKVKEVGPLCSVESRQAFYEEILEDRKRLRKKGVSEEDMSSLRVIIDIDPIPNKKKKGKGKRIKESNRGHRIFRDLRKLKNFLGLNIKYRGDSTPVDWSPKTGVCKYKKRAYQASVKLRGERIIGEKIWRKYIVKDA